MRSKKLPPPERGTLAEAHEEREEYRDGLEKRVADLIIALGGLVNACTRYDERPDSGVAHAAYMQAMDKARAALGEQ